jgi:hypothetical protein
MSILENCRERRMKMHTKKSNNTSTKFHDKNYYYSWIWVILNWPNFGTINGFCWFFVNGFFVGLFGSLRYLHFLIKKITGNGGSFQMIIFLYSPHRIATVIALNNQAYVDVGNNYIRGRNKKRPRETQFFFL